jgi:hypothetical protein
MTLTNVTIYRQGMFGVIRTDCKTVEIATGQAHAQYKDAIKVIYLQKGKRLERGFALTNTSDTCIIVDTKEAIDPRNPLTEPDEHGCSRSRYSGFSKAYWSELEEDLANKGITIIFDYAKGYPVSR